MGAVRLGLTLLEMDASLVGIAGDDVGKRSSAVKQRLRKLLG
jgi:hypothetical protein